MGDWLRIESGRRYTRNRVNTWSNIQFMSFCKVQRCIYGFIMMISLRINNISYWKLQEKQNGELGRFLWKSPVEIHVSCHFGILEKTVGKCRCRSSKGYQPPSSPYLSSSCSWLTIWHSVPSVPGKQVLFVIMHSCLKDFLVAFFTFLHLWWELEKIEIQI
jgi:hypothetical protein